MNINELREKVKNGDFDDNELIDLVLYLERENQALLEENQKYKEVIDKAIDKLYCWGEALDPEFQKIMLDILKEVE